MKKLLVRSLTGLLIVGIFLAAVLGGAISCLILLIILQAGCLREFYQLTEKLNFRPNKELGQISAAAVLVMTFLTAGGQLSPRIFGLGLLLFPVFFLFQLFRNTPNGIGNLGISLLGLIYAVLPMSAVSFLVFHSSSNYSPVLFIGLMIIIWTYDSGAYLVGCAIGKHRLFERISPKKSWEGAIGGLLLALLSAAVIARFSMELSIGEWLGFAMVTVIFATFGDLTESMLKREAGVKDSGHLIPGHGGLLDRFDSVLIAVPAVVAFLWLIRFF